MKKCWILLLLIAGISYDVSAEFFVIKNYDVAVTIYREGYFTVNETIDVEFSEQRHGIFREIPYRYNTPQGEEKRILFEDIYVDGHQFTTNFENGMMRIRIGDPDRYVEGRQRYHISYKVEQGFFFYEDHSEFYWNLIGTEWPVTIDKVNFKIDFNEQVDLANNDFSVSTGVYGNQGNDASIIRRSNSLFGSSSRQFQEREGMTVAIRFPVGHIAEPATDWTQYLTLLLLGIPIAIFNYFKGIYDRVGKNRKVTEMVYFNPPEGISASVSGAFVDDSSDDRDLICLIPQWGSQGLLVLEEEEKKRLIGKSKSLKIIKTGQLPQVAPQYEKTIFNALFDGRETVEVKDLKNEFYTHMQVAREQLTDHVRTDDLYTGESVEKSRSWLQIGLAILCLFAGIATAAVSVILFIDAGKPINIGMLLTGIALIATAIAGFIFQSKMLKRNQKGEEIWQQIKGFKMFIEKAEEPKLRRLLEDEPGYFDRTLPFAVTFGLAKEWASKFDGLFTEPPQWYHPAHHGTVGHSGFSDFAGNISNQVNTINSAFTSAPSSSGSGGGGGGFSGGGGGGGGGGSW